MGEPTVSVSITGTETFAAMVRAIDAVRSLHDLTVDDYGVAFCDHCSGDWEGYWDRVTYPCATVRAITAALNG